MKKIYCLLFSIILSQFTFAQNNFKSTSELLLPDNFLLIDGDKNVKKMPCDFVTEIGFSYQFKLDENQKGYVLKKKNIKLNKTNGFTDINSEYKLYSDKYKVASGNSANKELTVAVQKAVLFAKEDYSKNFPDKSTFSTGQLPDSATLVKKGMFPETVHEMLKEMRKNPESIISATSETRIEEIKILAIEIDVELNNYVCRVIIGRIK